MKNLLIIIILFTSSLGVFGQVYQQEKIVEIYGQEWYDKNELNNPGLLSIMSNYIDRGFVLEDVSDSKYLEFEQMEFVPLTSKTESVVSVYDFLNDYNSGNFNPLKYKFFPSNTTQFYKLKGINKIIKIQPQNLLLNQ